MYMQYLSETGRYRHSLKPWPLFLRKFSIISIIFLIEAKNMRGCISTPFHSTYGWCFRSLNFRNNQVWTIWILKIIQLLDYNIIPDDETGTFILIWSFRSLFLWVCLGFFLVNFILFERAKCAFVMVIANFFPLFSSLSFLSFVFDFQCFSISLIHTNTRTHTYIHPHT